MQGNVFRDESPMDTRRPKRLELGPRIHEATAIVTDSSSDSKGSGSSGATIAGAQGRALGTSLSPEEPCSSQRRAPALPPLGEGLRLLVPPGDRDGDLLLACEKLQLSPLRHFPFLKK